MVPPDAVTVAEPNSVESISVITTAGLTVTALPVDPADVGAATSTGAIATGTPSTVTAVVAGTLDFPWPSTTVKVTVTMPALPVVSVIDCSSCSYASTDAKPVNVTEFMPGVATTPEGRVP